MLNLKHSLLSTTILLSIASVSHAGDVLTINKVSKAPAIDGKMDSAWDKAKPINVSVSPIPPSIISTNKEKQTGKYAKHWTKDKYTKIQNVELRALYSDDHIYFLAKWKDDTKDDQHKPWKWEGNKKEGEYVEGKEREDRIAFSFPISGKYTANKLMHLDAVMDVWQWKAARTNGVGLAHDKSHVISKTRPAGKSAQHYDEKGNEVYVSRPGDGGESPYKSNKIDPFVYQGDLVQRYIPTMPSVADAADVKAKGVWKNGYWTVEFARKLNTGNSKNDTTFNPSKGSNMAIAVFDHAGDHFHAVSKELKMKFQ